MKIILNALARLLKEPSAREWSNGEIKKIAPFFNGKILNLSGGEDSDKCNSFYKKYFSNATQYDVSNYIPKNINLKNGGFHLDIEKKVKNKLVKRYDLVFSHTVLEHVFQIQNAVKNICLISNDYVLTIVPFLQSYHHEPWYNDYWRFTPQALIQLFSREGFKTIYYNWNNPILGNIYISHFCAKKDKLALAKKIQQKNTIFGPGSARDKLLFGLINSNYLYKK